MAYKSCIEKGITLVNDLLDEEGFFLTLTNLQNKYDIAINFLDYESLIHAIDTWIIKLDLPDTSRLKRDKGPIRPLNLKNVLKNKKGSQDIYKILNFKNQIPISPKKYANLCLAFDIKDWNKYYKLPFTCLTDTTLKWFQYTVLHRITVTNVFLYRIKISDTYTCNFCDAAPETIEHMLYDCAKVRDLWNTVERWIHNTMNIDITFTRDQIILGSLNKSHKVLNWLVINIKYYIFKTKLKKQRLNIFAIQNLIKEKLEIEQYILSKNLKNDIFEKDWAPWFKMIQY